MVFHHYLKQMKNKLSIIFIAALLIASHTSFCAEQEKKVKKFNAEGPTYPVQKKIKGNGPAYKNLQLEKLGRGIIAIHQGNGVVNVSWRMLTGDSKKLAFDLYRKSYKSGETNPNAEKLNAVPILKSTYFVDKNADTFVDQEYILQEAGSSRQISSYLLSVKNASLPYVSIPLPPIDGDTAGRYLPNDASVGDLNGDGEYEIILKRQIGNFACSQAGISGGTNRLEAYTLDGKRLWHIDLGINIREGAQYFQFIVFDFDGDGKSEIMCKTSEGTTFGDGKTIGDTDGDGITDYVIKDKNLRTYGKILDGPEFISVIEGTTGKELARGDYIRRGKSEDWGDDYGNRVDRQLAAVAYLDGKRPSFMVGRGYNGRSVIETWDYRNGKLIRLWRFDTHADNLKYIAFAEQGNHNIRIGDVDGDGRDEIIYGACVIDHDGTGLYSTGWGHGDALYLTDIDIDRPGLEIWQCHEYAPHPNGSSLREAATGKLLTGFPSTGDVGRAACADIDPRFRGCEIWSVASGGVRSAKGELISTNTPSVNMAVWWDGDLDRELLDKVYIDKWTGDGTDRIFNGKGKGITWCNGTKSTPCLQADIFGDWREEIIWPSEDGKEIRIYMTEFPTEYRFTTFMHDPIYRMSVATEMVGYNQPTLPGFYFGSDMKP